MEASQHASRLVGRAAQVALVELTREQVSPLTLLSAGASSGAALLAMLQVWPAAPPCRPELPAVSSCALDLPALD